MKRIGIAIHGNQAYQRGLLRGVRSFAASRGDWTLRLDDARHIALDDVDHASLDGLIIELYDTPLAKRLVSRDLPTVSLFRRWDVPDGCPTISCVWLDNALVGQTAAEYMLARGVTHFAVVGIPLDFSQDRIRGFRNRLAQAGKECFSLVTSSEEQIVRPLSGDAPAPENPTSRFLRALPPGTGLFATSDRHAFSLLALCEAIKIEVPGRLIVLGVDNDELHCESAATSLSSIDVNWTHVGWRAAGLLVQLLEGTVPPGTIDRIKPGRIVERDSTQYLPIDDAAVAIALVFVRRNFHRPIGIDDVVAASNIPKRSLQRRFLSAVGRGISDELRRVRVERARQMLETTELPLAEIATRCGFAGAGWLSRVFHADVGKPPGAYRDAVQRR